MKKHLPYLILVALLGAMLFLAPGNRQRQRLEAAPPPPSGATNNAINEAGQKAALFVPAGGAIRVNVSGTYTGTLQFQLSQNGGQSWTAATLYNTATATSDTSTTTTGTWLYTPATGGDGILQVTASAWTSGTAVVSMTDLIANPQKINIALFPSAQRTAQVTGTAMGSGNYRGFLLYVNITAASGTGGLTFHIQGYDPASGLWYDEGAAGIGTLTTVGDRITIWYQASGLNPYGYGATLPSQWRLVVFVGDSSSYTYSVAADLLP
jgi:hypothetical protein